MTADRFSTRSGVFPNWTITEFGAKVAEPLIGSDEFAKQALNRCKDVARREGTTTAEGRRDRLIQAVAMMVAKPFAGHTITDLAATAGMSRSLFAECFVAAFGLSPIGFLKRERLRVAAHLLWTSPLSVKIVAGRIGYESTSHFSRAFKGVFGMNPSDVAALGAANRAAAVGTGSAVPAYTPHNNSALDWLTREHLQLVCDITLDVLWDIDLRTGLVWWGEGLSRLFGYEMSQIGPDTSWCHDHIHPGDRERVVAGMKAACDSGASLWRDEFRYRKADGTYANVLDRGAIIRDSRGHAVRFVGAMNELAP